MNPLIVVPTYDEADNVLPFLEAVLSAVPEVEVLVVDDSSPDGTADLVRAHPLHGSRVHLLSRRAKDGLGAAYRAGFAWALAHDASAIVQMDADLSHPADRLPALLAALGSADVAVGSRYVRGGGAVDWPWSRRLVSWAGNTYVRLVLGLHVHDATAGFRAFRPEALRRLDVTAAESDGYCFQIENSWRAERLGLRVVEVPIVFSDRTAGTSKMSSAIVREALLRVLRWRWTEVRGVVAPPREQVAIGAPRA